MTRAATGYRPIPASTFGAWREQAACRSAGVNMFPDPGDEAGVDAALAVCAGCPVRAECRAATLHERYGVTGGLDEGQRKRIRARVR